MGPTSTLIAAVLTISTAQAQTHAAPLFDAKIGPIAFGAGDIETMEALGSYYTERIRGTVALCRYETSDADAHHAQARQHLLADSSYWNEHAARWSSPYIKQLLKRMALRAVDIAGIQPQVDVDIPRKLQARIVRRRLLE